MEKMVGGFFLVQLVPNSLLSPIRLPPGIQWRRGDSLEARDTSSSLPLQASSSFPGLVFAWGERNGLCLYLFTPLRHRTSVPRSWHFPWVPTHRVTADGRGEDSGPRLSLQACFAFKLFKHVSARPSNERLLEEVGYVTSFGIRSQESVTYRNVNKSKFLTLQQKAESGDGRVGAVTREQGQDLLLHAGSQASSSPFRVWIASLKIKTVQGVVVQVFNPWVSVSWMQTWCI